jgi:hypothetical protein
MTRADAENILQFVQALPTTAHSLVIHYEGGFSRSAGVVASLKELYGYEVEDARLVRANQSVVKTLWKWRMGKGQAPPLALKIAFLVPDW